MRAAAHDVRDSRGVAQDLPAPPSPAPRTRGRRSAPRGSPRSAHPPRRARRRSRPLPATDMGRHPRSHLIVPCRAAGPAGSPEPFRARERGPGTALSVSGSRFCRVPPLWRGLPLWRRGDDALSDWERSSTARVTAPARPRKLAKVPFVELADGRLQGVVSSGSDIGRVYVSSVAAGTYTFALQHQQQPAVRRAATARSASTCGRWSTRRCCSTALDRVARYLRVELADGEPTRWRSPRMAGAAVAGGRRRPPRPCSAGSCATWPTWNCPRPPRRCRRCSGSRRPGAVALMLGVQLGETARRARRRASTRRSAWSTASTRLSSTAARPARRGRAAALTALAGAVAGTPLGAGSREAAEKVGGRVRRARSTSWRWPARRTALLGAVHDALLARLEAATGPDRRRRGRPSAGAAGQDATNLLAGCPVLAARAGASPAGGASTTTWSPASAQTSRAMLAEPGLRRLAVLLDGFAAELRGVVPGRDDGAAAGPALGRPVGARAAADAARRGRRLRPTDRSPAGCCSSASTCTSTRPPYRPRSTRCSSPPDGAAARLVRDERVARREGGHDRRRRPSGSCCAGTLSLLARASAERRSRGPHRHAAAPPSGDLVWQRRPRPPGRARRPVRHRPGRRCRAATAPATRAPGPASGAHRRARAPGGLHGRKAGDALTFDLAGHAARRRHRPLPACRAAHARAGARPRRLHRPAALGRRAVAAAAPRGPGDGQEGAGRARTPATGRWAPRIPRSVQGRGQGRRRGGRAARAGRDGCCGNDRTSTTGTRRVTGDRSRREPPAGAVLAAARPAVRPPRSRPRWSRPASPSSTTSACRRRCSTRRCPWTTIVQRYPRAGRRVRRPDGARAESDDGRTRPGRRGAAGGAGVEAAAQRLRHRLRHVTAGQLARWQSDAGWLERALGCSRRAARRPRRQGGGRRARRRRQRAEHRLAADPLGRSLEGDLVKPHAPARGAGRPGAGRAS